MTHIPHEAVQAALDAVQGNIPPVLLEKAISAAIPHLSAPCAVEVRKLEWGELRHTSDYSFAQDAETSIGKYVATDNGWFLSGQSNWYNADSLEEAKAAAQADFKRRILSCVVTKPVDVAAAGK